MVLFADCVLITDQNFLPTFKQATNCSTVSVRGIASSTHSRRSPESTFCNNKVLVKRAKLAALL